MLKTLKYYIKKSIILNIADFFGLFIVFVINIILLNNLEKEVYGQYKYLISILSVLSILNFNGLNQFLKRDIAIGKDEVFLKYLKIKLGLLLLISGLFFIFILFTHNMENYKFMIFMIVPYFGFNITTSYFVGKSRFDKISYINFLKKIIWIILIYIYVFIVKDVKTNILFYIYILPEIILNIIYTFNIQIELNDYKEKKYDNKSNNSINDGIKLSFMEVFFVGSFNIESLIIKHYSDYEGVALFAAASIFIVFVKIIGNNFLMLFYPVFSKYKNIKENWLKIRNRVIILYFILFFIGIGVYYIIPYVYKFFIDEKYNISIRYSQYLMLFYIIFYMNNQLYRNLLTVHKKMLYLFNYRIIVSFLRLIMFVLFCKYYGISGLIFAKCISIVISNFVGFIIIENVVKK